MANELSNGSVIAAIVTGTITILSWPILNYLNKSREDRTRRLESKLKHVNKQIEELYGPLYSLIQQVYNIWEVHQDILKPLDKNDPNRERIIIYFREKYFYPLHIEIRSIIKTKFHLIEGIELPESFWVYLNHSTQETIQIDIWNNLQIDTQYVKGIPWSNLFEKDIKKTLDKLMFSSESLAFNLT